MTSAIAPAEPAQTVATRREQRGWYFYDWANSAFSTTVVTVFFGPYLTDVTNRAADRSGFVHPLGVPVRAGSFFPYIVSASVLITVVLLPVVGAVADRTRRKRELLGLFAYVGALATMALCLVHGSRYLLGGALFLVANVALGASVVVYNSFLPEIAAPEERDRVSSRGWALGYLGGGLLLAANLVLFLAHGRFGLSVGQSVRISLFSAGLWWAVFTLIPLAALRRDRPLSSSPAAGGALRGGLGQLGRTLRQARAYPLTLAFLAAYLFFNDGIQTVISLASVYGAEQLKLSKTTLIGSILIVQFLAFAGALLLGALARRYGAKRTVIASLLVWIAVIGVAYYLPARRPLLFVALAMLIGVVLGGSQALSRSMFSQLIPAGEEAAYFGLYEISERGTSWLGPLLFGLIFQITGSYRQGILSLLAFFVVGVTLLALVDVRRAVVEAGNRLPLRV